MRRKFVATFHFSRQPLGVELIPSCSPRCPPNLPGMTTLGRTCRFSTTTMSHQPLVHMERNVQKRFIPPIPGQLNLRTQ